MSIMAAGQAECVLADLDEVVRAFFSVSEPYTRSDYLVLFFLTGDSDPNACRLLLPFRYQFRLCRQR